MLFPARERTGFVSWTSAPAARSLAKRGLAQAERSEDVPVPAFPFISGSPWAHNQVQVGLSASPFFVLDVDPVVRPAVRTGVLPGGSTRACLTKPLVEDDPGSDTQIETLCCASLGIVMLRSHTSITLGSSPLVSPPKTIRSEGRGSTSSRALAALLTTVAIFLPWYDRRNAIGSSNFSKRIFENAPAESLLARRR